MNRRAVSFFLSGLSGLILCFAFPPSRLWVVALVGFGPLLLSLREGENGANFIRGFIAGFVFYGLLLAWISRVAGPFYLLLALYLACYWGIFAALLFAFPRCCRVWVGTGLWFFIEIIEASAFSGFPWLPLGLSQWSAVNIRWVASLVGINGISALVMAVNLSLFAGVRYRRYFSFIIVALMFGTIALIRPQNSLVPENHFLKIAAVQADAGYYGQPPDVSFNKYLDLSLKWRGTRDTGYEPCDLFVWPESSYPDVFVDGCPEDTSIKEFAQVTPVLFGTIISTEDGRLFNAAIFQKGYDGRQIYCKTHLVPYGEYLPGARFAPVRKIYNSIAGMVPGLSFPKKNQAGIFSFSSVKFAPLICFENIFTDIGRQRRIDGAEFFVVMTNDSWYGKSLGPYQHFAHNVFRAIENRVYVVQVSTTGITGCVSPDGKVDTVLEIQGNRLFVSGVLYCFVHPQKEPTIYARAGDLPLTLLFMVLTGAYICRV